MDIDRLMALAVRAQQTQLGQAQTRRTLQRAREEYARAVASGVDVMAGVDLTDPLHVDASEAAQIVRATQMAVLGRFTWIQETGEMTWSDEIWTMLGYQPGATPAPGMKLFLAHLHPDDRDSVYQAINATWSQRRMVRGTYRVVRKDGTVLDVDCSLEVLVNEHGQPAGVIGIGQDVTARERARGEVERLRRRCDTVNAALTEWDADSGLFTRRRFVDEVDRALRFGPGVVLIIRIEPVDDPSSGFRSGDGAELPRVAAGLLQSLKEPGDQLGRVGVNEIGILFPGTTLTKARKCAEYFVEVLRTQQFVTADGRLRALAWGGLVRYVKESQVSSQELLIDAEKSWRQAKDTGRTVVALSQPTPPHERQTACRDWITAALNTDQLTLYAQPILELASNTVTRHELLLRVIDEVNGPLPPVDMLNTAERLDTIYQIDLWVLEQAMELLQDSDNGRHLQVNLSGRSLGDARLVDAVERLIGRYQINPEQLTFEITETAIIGNMTEARRFTERVHDLGCQLALDDFGSGYGSFRSLKLFPIDLVKIDGEFIDNLANSAQDQVVVRAIAQVCQAHGVRTIAEFVQDEPTLEILRDIGVEFVQGYLIGKPRPVAALTTSAARRTRPGEVGRLRDKQGRSVSAVATTEQTSYPRASAH